MAARQSDRVEIALPISARVAAALGATLLIGMLTVLVAVLVSLEGTRSEIRTTRIGVVEAEQRFQRVTQQLSPLLSAVAPLTDEPAQRTLRSTGRKVAVAAGEVPAIADSAKKGADAATYLASTVGDAQLASSLTALRTLADAATGGDRLVEVLDSAARVLTSADGALQMLPAIRRLIAKVTRLLQTSARTQASTLSVLQHSAAIQREILSHVKSLDDKTLGRQPAALPGG